MHAAIGDELRQARRRLAPPSCTTPPYVAADARLCPRGTAHKGFVVEQRPTSLALVRILLLPVPLPKAPTRQAAAPAALYAQHHVADGQAGVGRMLLLGRPRGEETEVQLH